MLQIRYRPSCIHPVHPGVSVIVHTPRSSPPPPSPLLNALSVPQPRGESSHGIQCQPALIAALSTPPGWPEALCVFTSLHFHLTGLNAGGLNRGIQGRLQFPLSTVLKLMVVMVELLGHDHGDSDLNMGSCDHSEVSVLFLLVTEETEFRALAVADRTVEFL